MGVASAFNLRAAIEPAIAGWRDEAAYAHLAGAQPVEFAWEWLRRDEAYRRAFASSFNVRSGAMKGWGLCAAADPDRVFEAAKPTWDRSAHSLVLPVTASTGSEGEAIDLSPLLGRGLVVIPGQDGTEHCLFTSRRGSLRFDLIQCSVTGGPFVPHFLLEGAGAASTLLPIVRQFLQLARSGKLSVRPTSSTWSNRRILELRTRDALASGACQREVAAVLIDHDALRPEWRVGLSSVRSRAQRLAKASRQMEAGGWRSLLRPCRAGHWSTGASNRPTEVAWRQTGGTKS